MDGDRGFWAHETACIDDPGTIGEGTRIWHFSHIAKGATVGPRCSIGQNVYIAPGGVVGAGVKIQNNVSVYDGITLEDSVFCGPSVVFTNVFNPRSHISRKHEYRPTLVRHGTTIGANATLLCGITIGRFAFIGAGAVVTRDVPDFALITGNPGRHQGWMCRCGVKLKAPVRAGRKRVRCQTCGTEYRGHGGGLAEVERP
ncbi:MAG: N-acetyltransferase [Nitrospirae bacterium]|nr:MAG: N-acetyltransferase [Nitrospirota bacterium]